MKEKRARFAQVAIDLAKQYGVTLRIDWEKSIFDFHGEIEWQKWETLIAELTVLANQLGVADEKPCRWF